MKLLGLIGGVSPQSTAIYYRLLNDHARKRLGGAHSARILLYALDFGVMVRVYDEADWAGYEREVVGAGKALAAAGAEALMICSNTSHLAADAVKAATGLPVVHIVDVLSKALAARGSRRPLLLGTPAVMSGVYYLDALGERYDGEALVPGADDQQEIGRIIFEELSNGVVLDQSRDTLRAVIARHDCDGVILGCTELSMILSQDDLDLAVFDTTALHAEAGSAFAFEGV